MRRLKKWRPNTPTNTCRIDKICKTGRGLTTIFKLRWLHEYYHRRQRYSVKAEYGSKIQARCNRKHQRPGKLLRNKVFHVPKYKYVRANINDVNFGVIKSANDKWRGDRISHVRLLRELNAIHLSYMENNLQPHWWRI